MLHLHKNVEAPNRSGWGLFTYPQEGLLYILTFETYTKPPLSENDRWKHWGQKAQAIKDVRYLTAMKARHIPPLGRCDVSLIWYVNDKRRRDAENPVSTLKAMCDGLVDAGLVTDDTPDLMVKHMPVITYALRSERPAHMELHITPLGETE